MRCESFAINYPGNCISVNHYLGYRKGGGRFVKQETRDFQEELGWLVKTYHLEDWKLPLTITCSGCFKDKRSAPDLSNLSKVICDAIQEVTGINDKDFRWQDGTREIIDHLPNPFLTISIQESMQEFPLDAPQSKSRQSKSVSRGNVSRGKNKGPQSSETT